jgi:TPR repeat protein
MGMQDIAAAQEVCEDAKRQLALGSGPAIVEALAGFERAAALGCGEAHAKLAHLIAMGAAIKPDWDRSADLLQRAGELGWAPAIEELRLLSRGKGGTIAAMRAGVDIREWVAPRPTEIVCVSPRIRTLPAFMTTGRMRMDCRTRAGEAGASGGVRPQARRRVRRR